MPLAQALQGQSSDVISDVFSLDGTHVVSGTWDHTVHIWNAMTNGLEDVLEPHLGSVESIALLFLKVAKSQGSSFLASLGSYTLRQAGGRTQKNLMSK